MFDHTRLLGRAACRTTWALLLGVACGLAATSGAQSLFVPAGSSKDPTELNSRSNYPLMRTACRSQLLIAQSEMGTAAAMLSKVQWRYDGSSFGSAGGRLSSLEIWLGNSTVDPDKSSPYFAANHPSPLTRVLSRSNHAFGADTSVNPDVWGGPAGELVFVFDAPFSYTGGTLVMEIRVSGNTNGGGGAAECQLDAEEDPFVGPQPGSAVYNGSGCFGARMDVQGVFAPGGVVSCSGSGLGALGLVVNTLGHQKASIDLTAAGAPGCVVLNNWLLLAFSVADAGGNLAAYGADTTWGVPTDLSLNNANLELQLWSLTPANALGVVTSNNATVTLGRYLPIHRKYMAHFHHKDQNAPIAALSAPACLAMLFN